MTIKKLGILLVLLFVSTTVFAFPKYTTRENALRLAKVIDKGRFKSYHIASTFVFNHTPNDYYLRVTLNDGSSQEWFMDQIYLWSLNDQLTLSNNRALVFPSNESTEFHVLDKNAFYKLVIQSTAFIKKYDEHDMLAGKKLKFEKRRFRLIESQDDDLYATDEFGNRYRYVLEFINGSREVLTYLDAYQLMNNGAFIQKPEETDLILERAFQVRDIVVSPKQLEDEIRNIWSFGIEVIFDKKVFLSPDKFPYQIVEESFRNPNTGERVTRFFIHVLFPNAEITQEIRKIRTLEYLQNVKLITDIANSNRVFLRAQINPEIFELPPYIEITDRHTVKVYFFIVTDQSIVKRPEFFEDGFEDMTIHPTLRKIPSDTPFDQFYLEAVGKIRSVQANHSLNNKIKIYLEAIDLLRKASLNAFTDKQLSQSLKQRDQLYGVLPRMVIDNAKEHIQKGSPFDHNAILEQIEIIKQITANREYLKQLQKLEKAIM